MRNRKGGERKREKKQTAKEKVRVGEVHTYIENCSVGKKEREKKERGKLPGKRGRE